MELIRKSCSSGEKFSHETNDCTVRALSNAFDIPYEKAHGFLKKKGRKDKRGFHFYTIFKSTKCSLFKHRVSFHDKPHKSLATFVKQHPEGTFIIGLNKHVTVLREGVIIDSFLPKAGRHVQYYYRISKIK